MAVIYSYIRGNQLFFEKKKLIEERDKLFSHTLARSIAIYVQNNSDAVARLAGSASRREFTFDDLYPVVRNAVVNSNAFFAMSIADRDGIIVAGYNKLGTDEKEHEIRGINISDRDYYCELLATKKIVFSDTIYSRVEPFIPTVAIAVPIFDERKEFAGFAVGGLSLDALNHLAEAALGSEFAIPVVIDKKGSVIVHSNVDFVKDQKLLSGFEPAELALAGKEGFLDAFIDTDGVERSAAYAAIPELGWGVWIAQDTAQFAAARKQVFFSTAVLSGGFLFGIFIVFLILSRMFLRPLANLTDQAIDRVGTNNFDEKIEILQIVKTREVSELTELFNKLMLKIRESFSRQQENVDMKTKFLSVTTHAFRTPLNVLQWNLSSILENIDEYRTDQKTVLLDMYESTQRLILGFENLFTAFEINEKTNRSNYKKINVLALVENAMMKLRELARKGDVSLLLERHEDVVIAGDQEKLQRVFEILLANAIFYNRKQGTVTINFSKEKDFLLLSVRDTGIGMTKEDKKHLFEPFFRGRRAVLKYTDGIGLGLFIAKSFIDLHKGSLEVISKESEGTTVIVRLPIKVDFPS
ncbi:MAG: sensor histidine kinase [Parcubacteria group bacterium]|nr:sensor histidine kinase [Parcubacteria group bacterium]